MKIIRINSCSDCDRKRRMPTSKQWGYSPNTFVWICNKLEKDIDNHVMKKTLPDNCPLEDMPESSFESSFGFLKDKSEDIYTASDGDLITFTKE